jgi:hypothetical protein
MNVTTRQCSATEDFGFPHEFNLAFYYSISTDGFSKTTSARETETEHRIDNLKNVLIA